MIRVHSVKTSTAKEPSKGIRGARAQGAARGNKWFLSRSMLVNFGVLVALFSAVLLVSQLGQKLGTDAGKNSDDAVTAQVEAPPPKIVVVKKSPARKSATTQKADSIASNEIALDSLAQKKKSIAWGDFIPFEKKR